MTPLLDTDDRQLQQAALEIIGRHEGWAEDTLPLLRRWLSTSALPPERHEALRSALITMSSEQPIQQLIAEKLVFDQTLRDMKLLLLDVIANSELAERAVVWQEPIRAALGTSDELFVRQAIRAGERFGATTFQDQLNEILDGDAFNPETKLAAASAIARAGQPIDDAVFGTLLRFLDADNETLARMAAADALSTAQLTEDQFRVLMEDTVSSAGPMELRAILRAFEKNQSPKLGLELLAALEQAAGLLSLTTHQLQAAMQSCPEDVQSAAAPLLEQIRANSQLTSQRLNELEAQVVGGHTERGRAVFLWQESIVSCLPSGPRRRGCAGPGSVEHWSSSHV